MEVSILFVGIALLILLAVTSMRYGVDSRDGFASPRRELPAGGIVWDVPAPAGSPKPLKVAQNDDPELASAPADCGLAPCAA